MTQHSSVITQKCLNHPNPHEMEEKIWRNTRYLVAQKPADEKNDVTNDMFYMGKATLPGPKADQALTGLFAIDDLATLKAKHSIQFVDFNTTAGAPTNMTEAHYTVMSNSDADNYERMLRQQIKQEQAL